MSGAGDIPVTVVVPVRNEELNLARCLERLGRFAEVVVVDSASTDRTCEIARNAGAQLVNFAWNGRFPKKRNWMLLNHQFRTEWVLFLDADELVNPAFCKEVAAAVARTDARGYWLQYDNFFLGRRLRHGVPQRKLALVKVGAGLFERIDEDRWSTLDMEVHEHPIIEGEVGEISAHIDHDDKSGLSKFVDRHREYAAWEARRFLKMKGDPKPGLTRRQSLKYASIESWWFAYAYFFYTYLIRRGFLDLSPGFYYAFYKFWYFVTVRLMIRELRAANSGRAEAAGPDKRMATPAQTGAPMRVP